MDAELLRYSSYCAHPLGSPIGIGAFMFLVYGLCELVLWWRDREPGVQWVGLSALGAVVFFGSETMGWIDPPGKYFQPVWAALVLEASAVLWAVGMQQFIDPARWWRRGSTWLVVAPQLLMMLLHALAIPVLLIVGSGIFTMSFGVVAVVAWRARRHEPGAGLTLLAAALATLPVSSIAMQAAGVDLIYIRYVAIPSLLVFHTMVLVVYLHRRRLRVQAEAERRRAVEDSLAQANDSLAEANASLERRIAERTADLRDVIAGLHAFTRNISHDLRGPLGGIEGMAAVARKAMEQGRTDDAARFLGTISRQARNSNELLVSLLELARVGDARVHRADVPLAPLVTEIVDELRQRAPGQPLPEIRVESLPTVAADRGLLRAVFTNLLSNACKFTRDRRDARVEVGARLHDGDWAVYVRDNGAGFEPEAATSLFQPFQRLHGPEYQGHGVGLSIVRRAVERHGGRVWAEARPEQGACFWFTLPSLA